MNILESAKKIARAMKDRMWDFFTKESSDVENKGKPSPKCVEDMSEVQAALELWKVSRKYFEQADDPDVIDYAIYNMESARRRYDLLIRNAKAAAYENTYTHNDISV